MPIISSGEYPKTRVAALFQLVMMPFKSLLKITSSEDATIAASSPRCFALSRSSRSLFRISVTSRAVPRILPRESSVPG